MSAKDRRLTTSFSECAAVAESPDVPVLVKYREMDDDGATVVVVVVSAPPRDGVWLFAAPRVNGVAGVPGTYDDVATDGDADDDDDDADDADAELLYADGVAVRRCCSVVVVDDDDDEALTVSTRDNTSR